MLSFKTSALAVTSACMLAACSGQDVNSYTGKAPEITIQGFYSTPIEGYGFFQDRSGQVTDRYYATLIPEWHGNEGTLTEKQWNDKGELFLQQTWKIHVADNGHDFTATATKIDGTVLGETRGYAMHMTYTMLAATGKGDDIRLHAEDWTYLQPDGSGLNKVALSKYGFHVGDVTYDLHKVPKNEKLHDNYFAN